MNRLTKPKLLIVLVLLASPWATSFGSERDSDFGSKRGSGTLENVVDYLSTREKVDLMHTLDTAIPIPEGLPPPIRTDFFDGAVQQWTLVGQTGTHLDAPGHFHTGMALLDDIPIGQFILKGVVINISDKAKANNDYQLQLSDITEWEHKHGPIPKDSIVILRTDWSKRWPNPKSYFNTDANGVNHYPGWSRESLQYLVEKRDIRAIAHETPDTDSGATALSGPSPWPLEDYFLGTGRWQIENLANADKLPPRGFMVVVGVPKIGGGTGFPVRAIAILP